MSFFISALQGLATQSKAQMKLRFIEIETAIKIKLSSVLEQLNHRHSQRERVLDFDDDQYFNDTAEQKEVYSVPPNAEKPTNWFARTLWALL